MTQSQPAPPVSDSAARQLERNLKSAALLELLLAWPNSYTQHLDDQPALPADLTAEDRAARNARRRVDRQHRDA